MKLNYKVYGYIHGNNLYDRGYFDGILGLETKEPFYIREKNGDVWSAFDVGFKPDDKEQFLNALKESGASEAFTEF